MPNTRRYPDNWHEIALAVKERCGWRCAKCNLQCLRPGDSTKNLTKSQQAKLKLNVHHQNRIPEDNRPENLIPLCSACHLLYHTRKRANISPGQLSLFEELLPNECGNFSE